MVQESPDREVPTGVIGEFLMDRLRELDRVAFVRFASVYRDFKDVDQFMATLKGLLETTREVTAPRNANETSPRRPATRVTRGRSCGQARRW